MTTNNKRKNYFQKNWVKAYLFILIGSFLFAAGDVMFVNPYRLAPGGTYGLGKRVQHPLAMED